MNKISLVMLSALATSSIALATVSTGSSSTQTTEAANYAAQKNNLVANINARQKDLEREEFKLNELLRKVELGKQSIRDAQLNLNQAKSKLNELESHYRSLPQY